MRTDPNSRSHLDALCNYANEGACVMRLSAELSVCDCDPGRCFILQFNHGTDEQRVWTPQTHTEGYSQNHDEWSLRCVIYSKVGVRNNFAHCCWLCILLTGKNAQRCWLFLINVLLHCCCSENRDSWCLFLVSYLKLCFNSNAVFTGALPIFWINHCIVLLYSQRKWL